MRASSYLFIIWIILSCFVFEDLAFGGNLPQEGIVKIITDEGNKVGTGLIINIRDQTAYILTAAHVIEGVGTLSIKFHKPGESPVIGKRVPDWINPETEKDLAVIKVEKLSEGILSSLRVLKLGNSARVKEGEKGIITCGHVFDGEDWKYVNGTIGKKKAPDEFIFSAAGITPGYSGAPLWKGGRVIGMIKAVHKKEGSADYYALQSNTIKSILKSWEVPLPSFRISSYIKGAPFGIYGAYDLITNKDKSDGRKIVDWACIIGSLISFLLINK
jgi:S1-C subfamily serine protease